MNLFHTTKRNLSEALSLVSLILVYISCLWSPYIPHDIQLLKKIHKCFAKMVPEIKNMLYPDKLKTTLTPSSHLKLNILYLV